MKIKYFLLCVITLLSCNINKKTSSQKTNNQIEGKWYLVTRNNLRVTEIKSDSIYISTTKDFIDINISSSTLNKSYKITNQIINRDSVKFEVIDKNKELDELLFMIDNKAIIPRLLLFNNSEKHKNHPPFRFIHDEELKSYKNLKDTKDITEEDFIAFANKSIELKNRAIQHKLSRHFIFSEIKLLLVDLGYNPLIELRTFEEQIEKFSNRPNVKELYTKMKG